MTPFAACALIALGTAVMAVNIDRFRKLSKEFQDAVPQAWTGLRRHILLNQSLMVFFLLGYLAVFAAVALGAEGPGTLMTAIIFLAGAVFVFLGVRLQAAMLARIERERYKLAKSNAMLRKEILERVRAENENVQKTAFLNMASHELRTPLTSIIGFAKIIRRDIERIRGNGASDSNKGERQRRACANLDIIVEEGERLSRLIGDALDLTKIEAGKIAWRDKDVQLTPLLRKAADSMGGLLEGKTDRSFEARIPEDLPTLRLDPDRLLQVVLNLLTNAVKYGVTGRILLEARREAGKTLITVEDEGPGVSREEAERIFEPFHRLEDMGPGLADPGGTGLGLTISRQIVKHYGGRLWADSKPGGGGAFHMELPVP